MVDVKMDTTFVNGYEEDFSYSFTISESTKNKYLVKIELYTNTRFPVREFVKRVENFSEIAELNVRNLQKKWIGLLNE